MSEFGWRELMLFSGYAGSALPSFYKEDQLSRNPGVTPGEKEQDE